MNANLHTQVEDVIKRVLVSELGISAVVLQTISSTTPLLGRGIGLDSSETVAVVVGIEEKFGISVPDSDLTADLFNNVHPAVEKLDEEKLLARLRLALSSGSHG